MIQPVSLGDIGVFLNNIISAYDDYVFFVFVMMCSFSVMFFIKNIIIGRSI